MDAMTLFEIIGNARDKYVVEAEKLRSGEVPAVSRGVPRKRLLLAAAVLALTALLVGCAVVYALRIQNLKVGEFQHYISGIFDDTPAEEPKPITLISLQGTHLEAMTEWIAFIQA